MQLKVLKAHSTYSMSLLLEAAAVVEVVEVVVEVLVVTVK